MGRPKRKQGAPVYFREWRESRNLTQERLADSAGLSQETISKLERGKVDYTKSNLEALAHAFGCEPAALLRPPHPVKNELAEFLMGLDAKKQGRALRTLQAMFDDEGQPVKADKSA